MQQSNQPPKFVIPFAQNDPAKAVIPATSPDDTRASQALGFPPRTGLPPEAGGVPPQKADMNGALNQLAGPILWALAGGRFAFDNAFASDANVAGYPLGADLLAADARGSWVSTANDNTANPDTVGTGWVPGYHYGATALAGQTGGTVTLSPAQAAKRVITVAGTLTSNLVLVVPGWVYDWSFYNNTSGAFSVSVRTAAGSAAAIPQNGAPTPVKCDGTNCSLVAANIAPATSNTQALQLGQATGRVLRTSVYGRDGAGVQVVSVDGSVSTPTGADTFTALAAARLLRIRVIGGGGGGGGAQGTSAGQQSAAGGGGGGAYCESIIVPPGSATTVTVGVGGAGAVAGLVTGTGGGSSTFGSLMSAGGGAGGPPGGVTAGSNVVGTAGGGVAGGGVVLNSAGQPGGVAIIVAAGAVASGAGAAGVFGGGGQPASNSAGAPARGPGAGGSGGACTQNVAGGAAGGAGSPGYIEVIEYA